MRGVGGGVTGVESAAGAGSSSSDASKAGGNFTLFGILL
jgi:hypothetical protein